MLASSLDPDETLRQVAQLAVPEIADWCAVDLAGEDSTIERVALVHADPELLAKAASLRERYPPTRSRRPACARILETGESQLYPEIPEELLEQGAVDEEHLELIREFGLRSAMAVPMIARDAVDRRAHVRERPLGPALRGGGPAGGRGARPPLRDRDGQRPPLQPSAPTSPARSSAACCRPSCRSSPASRPRRASAPTGEGNEVGGDFYDLFETGGRGWTVVIGDVCGKGPDAAAVTALARYTLRAAAMHERLPSRSLRLLNEALLRQRRRPPLLHGRLRVPRGPRGGRASRLRERRPSPAGAPARRRRGRVARRARDAAGRGRATRASRTARRRSAPGDAVVFYTDGVTEAGGPGGILAEERLADVVASCAGMHADAIAGRVEAAALAAEEGPPRDDIAVVVLRVAPNGHRNGSDDAAGQG